MTIGLWYLSRQVGNDMLARAAVAGPHMIPSINTLDSIAWCIFEDHIRSHSTVLIVFELLGLHTSPEVDLYLSRCVTSVVFVV